MGRPKQLDREKALNAAKLLFWERSYSNVSADDLTKTMGIARQSLYMEFGSKRELYLEALRSYNSGNLAALITLLRDEHSPRETLRRVLLAPSLLPKQDRERGCFNVNSISEFGLTDAEVLEARNASRIAASLAFESLINEGKRKGEFHQCVDTKTASNYIASVLAGIMISARAGAKPKELESIGEMAMNALSPAGGNSIS